MRRLILVTALVAVGIAPGCRYKRTPKERIAINDGEPVSLLSVADPRAEFQLTKGFWTVEGGAWRWTMKNFTVTLRPPAGSAEKGAALELKFTIPDVMFNRVGAMTVDAHVNGQDLGPEKYPSAGVFSYKRDVPAALLGAPAVAIDFSVDKGLPPSDQDTRELALIVSSIGLLPK
jgi:hypothetical protein